MTFAAWQGWNRRFVGFCSSGPGTAKTHIATALGVQAIEHHRKKVRFFATVDLVNAFEQEKAMNKAGQLADRLSRLDLVILAGP